MFVFFRHCRVGMYLNLSVAAMSVPLHYQGEDKSCVGKIVLTAIAAMWADAPPSVKEFFEHAKDVHMAWRDKQVAEQKKLTKVRC